MPGSRALSRIVAELVASETLMNRLYTQMNDIISLTMVITLPSFSHPVFQHDAGAHLK